MKGESIRNVMLVPLSMMKLATLKVSFSFSSLLLLHPVCLVWEKGLLQNDNQPPVSMDKEQDRVRSGRSIPSATGRALEGS